jgi:hypothetical protein
MIYVVMDLRYFFMSRSRPGGGGGGEVARTCSCSCHKQNGKRPHFLLAVTSRREVYCQLDLSQQCPSPNSNKQQMWQRLQQRLPILTHAHLLTSKGWSQKGLDIMLKQTPSSQVAVPNNQWFEFVTGLSEPQFITRRSEAIQPDPSHSSILQGIDIGPSLQIRSVHAACPEHSAKSQKSSFLPKRPHFLLAVTSRREVYCQLDLSQQYPSPNSNKQQMWQRLQQRLPILTHAHLLFLRST